MRCCRSIGAGVASIRTTGRPASRRSTACRCARRTTGRRSSFDVGAVNDVLSPLFVAGFYYKTFMWPRSFWDKLYEPWIRAAAGLGRAPGAPDPDRYQHRHAHCDVLVVGAGPAGPCGGAGGIARAASGSSSPTSRRRWAALCCTTSTASIDGKSAWDWLAEALAALGARDNVIAAAAHDRLRLLQSQPHRPGAAPHRPPAAAAPRPAARAAVAGARRARWCWQPARTSARSSSPATTGPASCWPRACAPIVNRYGVAPGRRVVIATSGASAYTAAADLKSGRAGRDASSTCARRATAPRRPRSCARAAARSWPGTPFLDRAGASASPA